MSSPPPPSWLVLRGGTAKVHKHSNKNKEFSEASRLRPQRVVGKEKRNTHKKNYNEYDSLAGAEVPSFATRRPLVSKYGKDSMLRWRTGKHAQSIPGL